MKLSVDRKLFSKPDKHSATSMKCSGQSVIIDETHYKYLELTDCPKGVLDIDKIANWERGRGLNVITNQ